MKNEQYSHVVIKSEECDKKREEYKQKEEENRKKQLNMMKDNFFKYLDLLFKKYKDKGIELVIKDNGIFINETTCYNKLPENYLKCISDIEKYKIKREKIGEQHSRYEICFLSKNELEITHHISEHLETINYQNIKIHRNENIENNSIIQEYGLLNIKKIMIENKILNFFERNFK